MSKAIAPGRAAAHLPGVLRALAGAWRYATARNEFERLDSSALRDLGMSRSEFDSYWAETQGLVEPTRTRVRRGRRRGGS